MTMQTIECMGPGLSRVLWPLSRQRKALKLKIVSPRYTASNKVANESYLETYAKRQTPSSSGLRSTDRQP